jgi:hypothetical protein
MGSYAWCQFKKHVKYWRMVNDQGVSLKGVLRGQEIHTTFLEHPPIGRVDYTCISPSIAWNVENPYAYT